MTTKTVSVSGVKGGNEGSARSLVKAMTWMAWVVFGIGLLLCLFNLYHFSDQNTGLMVGLGFLVGSVHIYVIGTAMGLVHERMNRDRENERSES
ncbi:hypothetical protein PAE9249_02910 [Paenibacillus sp. CECT 9249]|uniref:hypothetical protein n=1 Tax=Paenibacillus sp. CECT 9249 TaxID=2845385 RepID=UPI001E37AF6C|nr:hypothetical protein [Paenibacillus sp. CECT 9249]CAH0120391.1 hypothetical protein PAE9249_02910 [Paenibacillus sp. CECT 9249]